MAEIGSIEELKVVKQVDFGVYLDGGELGEILLPTYAVPPNSEVDDTVEVFIYRDSEDRVIATTSKPLAVVGDFAMLSVIEVNQMGAFLDWGLQKDLLVPFREQKQKMELGKSYLVHVYLDDESQRIVASTKLDKFLDNLPFFYKEGQEVNLLIAVETDLGYKAIINNLYWGMLYKNEVFQLLELGQKTKGYVKQIREDEKIDLILRKQGESQVDELAEKILRMLKEANGILEFSDKSPAEQIYETFGASKKVFKKALGLLYKKRLIKLEKERIVLKT